jgi:MFS family permease
MKKEDKSCSEGRLSHTLAVLAAASGILVIAAAAISLAMVVTHVYILGNPTMIDQWQQLFLQRTRVWFAEAISAVLVASGVANVVGSYMLYKKPCQAEKWGYLVLMGSVTALFWMGGFLVGPLLGILAGAIAVYQGRKLATAKESQLT